MTDCCVCGSEVDTREIDKGGGPDGCELTDNLWVCSRECYNIFLERENEFIKKFMDRNS